MKCYNTKIKLLNYLWLSKEKQNGFTLLELLIAMLIVTLFVSLSLEGMLLASLAQIRARDRAEASLKIQQDLAAIRSLAANYTLDTSGDEFKARCNGTWTPPGKSSKQNILDGFSAYINSNLDLLNPSQYTSAASTSSYTFSRTLTPSTTNTNILQITYNVTDPKTSNSLAQLSTEVIPDVAFQCP